MFQKIKISVRKHLLPGVLFLLFYLYFAFFNKYHILYLEQNQLFLWNLDFLKEQFSLPGGFTIYAGSFFTQFFVSYWLGALIYTLNALTIFVLTLYIFKRHNFSNIILCLVPVWLLTILHSSELFTFSQAIGFLLLISFFALYITVKKTVNRYVLFFAGWTVLYILAGGFAVPVIILCVLHEILFRKQKSSYLISAFYVITGVMAPYLFSKLIFYIQPDKIFTWPVNFELSSYYLYALIIFFVWFPLVLIVSYFLNRRMSLLNNLLSWNFVNVLAGTFIILFMGFTIYKYAFNKKADLMLGIDYHVQKTEWEKVLKLSERYPGYNTLVIYYTNIALYKTGQLFDKMFNYPQIGSRGLRLQWARNLNLFFGGELFYQLSYNNESIHWAFEALVAKGLNPRSLKRLIVGFMVNGNLNIAGKYINILKQTLFYRKWAQKHEAYLSDPALAKHDSEISRNIDLRAYSNFFSEVEGMNLQDLLANHPENKMAYEYLIASLLLDKNLDGFARAILSLKNYGYKRLPVHIEEALIFYNFYERQNVMPEGFTFRPETITKFNAYATTYTRMRSDRTAASNALKKKYGNTYWYYLQFINN
jgi:hypothetical protein